MINITNLNILSARSAYKGSSIREKERGREMWSERERDREV